MAATTIKSRRITVDQDVPFATFKITGLGDPTAAQDGATKAYVDLQTFLLLLKKSVVVATTANITLSGTQTIDGVGVIALDRVLVKNQTTASENGIYDVAAGAWARSSDAATSAMVKNGMFTWTGPGGSANASKEYRLTTADPITLGSTNLTFTANGGTVPSFVNNEVPSGTINGSNTAFTLASTPSPASSLELTLDGQKMTAGGADFTLSGAAITFVIAPPTGSVLLAAYRF